MTISEYSSSREGSADAFAGLDERGTRRQVAALLQTGVQGEAAVAGACSADWEKVVEDVVRLIAHLRDKPFATLEVRCRDLVWSYDRLTQALRLVRQAPELETAGRSGPHEAYWSSTLDGLDPSRVEAAVAHSPLFPQYVGLHPGPVCMFRCTFCARVSGARYGAESVPSGTQRMVNLIDSAPRGTTFYVSGGLEPLTNPGLSQIAQALTRNNFSAQLYTNGFALTRRRLIEDPQLWNFRAIRFSIYGFDETEYAATTGRRGAFSRVCQNLVAALRYRDANRLATQVGINFVMVSDPLESLRRLARFLSDLQRQSVELDFVTLRQDYSEDATLDASHATRLRQGWLELDSMVQFLGLATRIHLGYGLHALAHGLESHGGLLKATWEKMRPAMHPQISVVIDLLGDVYGYRGAGFPDLPGANRFRLGTLADSENQSNSLMGCIKEFLSGDAVQPRPGDEAFMDAFDHVVTLRLAQIEADRRAGAQELAGSLPLGAPSVTTRV